MATPRAHADLAKLYFSDNEMGCWMWNEGERVWQPDYDPSFNPRFIYHVGKEAPTEPPQIMCELAGVKFPMPETKAPDHGNEYWAPSLVDPDYPEYVTWRWELADEANLVYRFVHLNRDAAIYHGRALVAANLQAIEKAEEQMK